MSKIKNRKKRLASDSILISDSNITSNNKLTHKNQATRIELQPENIKSGLGKLILTLLRLIHELLEKQAIRHMDEGNLTDEQIERLGYTLMEQARELNRLREIFGLKEEELNLNLGPFGKLL